MEVWAIVVLSLFGVACMLAPLQTIFSGALRSTSWPRVSGSIVNVEVETTVKASTQIERIVYYLSFSYKYEVKGKEYKAKLFSFGKVKEYSDRELALKACNEYISNPQIDVYYHPKNPNIAVMLPGYNKFTFFIPLILGLGFIWLAIYGAFGGMG